MVDMNTNLSLTDNELVLLDGNCRKEIQSKVDEAKERLSIQVPIGLREELVPFFRRVIQEAKASGKLVCRPVDLSLCGGCGRTKDYVRFKSGRRAGQRNYNKPKYLRGMELASRFLTIKGYPALGLCKACFDEIKPYLRAALEGVQAELPTTLMGYEPKYKKYPIRRCRDCGWEGGEHLMGRLPALMGGTYPGKCPKCGAESLPFGPTKFDTTDTHIVVAQE